MGLNVFDENKQHFVAWFGLQTTNLPTFSLPSFTMCVVTWLFIAPITWVTLQSFSLSRHILDPATHLVFLNNL